MNDPTGPSARGCADVVDAGLDLLGLDGTRDALDSICGQAHHQVVLIDWSSEFNGWLDRLEARADAGDSVAERTLQIVTAQLEVLQELQAIPELESATFKRVRQSRRFEVWRVAHPFDPGIALRMIVWFPPDTGTVVVTLFAGDKARMGDVFYNSVGTRADAAIDSYRRTMRTERGDDDHG